MGEIIKSVVVEITGPQDEVLQQVSTELGFAYQEIGRKNQLLQEGVDLMNEAVAQVEKLTEQSQRQQDTIARLQQMLAEERERSANPPTIIFNASAFPPEVAEEIRGKLEQVLRAG